MGIMKLSNEAWIEIRTKYEMGDSIRSLAKKYGITHSTIQNRIKSAGWTQEIATHVTDIKGSIEKISRVAEKEQATLIVERLKTEICETFDIVQEIKSLDNRALLVNSKLLKAAEDGLDKKLMHPLDVQKIVSGLGLNVSSIGDRAGIGKAGTQVNVNTQVNDSEKVVFEIQPVGAK